MPVGDHVSSQGDVIDIILGPIELSPTRPFSVMPLIVDPRAEGFTLIAPLSLTRLELSGRSVILGLVRTISVNL